MMRLCCVDVMTIHQQERRTSLKVRTRAEHQPAAAVAWGIGSSVAMRRAIVPGTSPSTLRFATPTALAMARSFERP